MHQRTNRGQSRGKEGESTPSRPTQNNKRRAEPSNQGKTTARPPRPAEPTTRKPKQTKTGKDTGHQRKTKAGRSEHAVLCSPQRTTKRKQPRRSTQENKRPNGRLSGDQTKNETGRKRIKEYKCTLWTDTQVQKQSGSRYGRTETDVKMHHSRLRVCTWATAQSKGDQDLSAAMVEVSKIERGYGANSIYLSNLKNGHR